ncbi:MAG: hypothetical protein IPI51_04390 [Betaproteobacteria bacterium]|nr:hypothetical protein [Betaproteobacteria bacterium]
MPAVKQRGVAKLSAATLLDGNVLVALVDEALRPGRFECPRRLNCFDPRRHTLAGLCQVAASGHRQVRMPIWRHWLDIGGKLRSTGVGRLAS